MHAILLERWGGHPGGGHRGAADEGADAAVQAVKNSYYDRVEELAAAYAVYIVQRHVFLDGNKRAGAAAMLTFLAANGITVRAGSIDVGGDLELQERAERGEDTGSLVDWLAGTVASPRRASRADPSQTRPRVRRKR